MAAGSTGFGRVGDAVVALHPPRGPVPDRRGDANADSYLPGAGVDERFDPARRVVRRMKEGAARDGGHDNNTVILCTRTFNINAPLNIGGNSRMPGQRRSNTVRCCRVTGNGGQQKQYQRQ